MSTAGGAFALHTINQGPQDAYFNNQALLSERLVQIRKSRIADLMDRPENQSQDPQKVIRQNVKTINPTLAEIEQTHIIPVRSVFKPTVPMAQVYLVGGATAGTPTFGSTMEFEVPRGGEFMSDACIHVRMSSVTTASSNNQVKYADNPGHKLFDKVVFKIGNSIIDSYTPHMANAFLDNEVSADERPGYLRAIGQETLLDSYVVPDPTADNIRLHQKIGVGMQTMKRTHPEFDMYIPLWFFFRDYKQALAIGRMQPGQVKIEVQIAARANLLVMGLASPSSLTGEALLSDATNGITGISIKSMRLIANHLFMQPDMFNLFSSRAGLSLIRVRRVHEVTLTTTTGTVRLNNLIWPIEQMYIGFHPTRNDTGVNSGPDVVDPGSQWVENNYVTRSSVSVAVITAGPTIASNSAYYYTKVPTVDSVGLKVSGNELAPLLSTEFYTNYTSTRGGSRRSSGLTANWLVFNFNPDNGRHQYMMYLNSSRARELVVEYNTDLTISTRAATTMITASNPAKIQAIATCLNLLINDLGSATMFFTT